MSELPTIALGDTTVSPLALLGQLLTALVLGWVVALVYKRARRGTELTASFPPTLVLLAILIAMVTPLIGNSLARAFGLVGALSIVRFRTVVRDTQDTAFVIFAVVVGMAVGADSPAAAIIGIVVVSLAAFLMIPKATAAASAARGPFRLDLRVATGHDLNGALAAELDTFTSDRQLLSVGTARQGMALGVSYSIRFRAGTAPEDLVKALNRLEGVQNVELALREIADP
jgi:hypothetical protein